LIVLVILDEIKHAEHSYNRRCHAANYGNPLCQRTSHLPFDHLPFGHLLGHLAFVTLRETNPARLKQLNVA
jgi:hypothetical protein